MQVLEKYQKGEGRKHIPSSPTPQAARTILQVLFQVKAALRVAICFS